MCFFAYIAFWQYFAHCFNLTYISVACSRQDAPDAETPNHKKQNKTKQNIIINNNNYNKTRSQAECL